MTDVGATWPFWAPSREAAVHEALDLGAVSGSTTFVDLGCGDGQVLRAAADRGATVIGVEFDPGLAAEAQANVPEARIVVGDLYDAIDAIDADVWFTYLAPASLQRLLPSLDPRGAQLLTVDFDVPGRIPTRRGDATRRYRLPGRRRPVGPVGWPAAGTLVATSPDCNSLSCLELVAGPGPAHATVAGGLADVVTAFTGADHLDERAALAVDLRWEPTATGTVTAGTVEVGGAVHTVVVAFTDEDESVEHSLWDLTGDGVANLLAALDGTRPPTSVAGALAAAEG